MQLTRTADYAVRVMILLAGLPSGSRSSREDLAQAGQIPSQFLCKVLQAMVRGGLIASFRGVRGGFSLAQRPDELTMLDVIEAIEGPLWLNQCVDPGQGCARQPWCAAHGLWVEAQDAVSVILRSASIQELAERSPAPAHDDHPPCVLGGGIGWV
jgi:Rrf2 family protein